MGTMKLTSRAIIGEFYNRLQQNTSTEWIGDVSGEPFPSNQASETYNWIGMSPVMREWIGGRQARSFSEQEVIIKNKDFEATIEVLVHELQWDKTGQVMIRIRELADRTNAHWAKLLSTLLIDGESKTCYDGQFFFDTDHAEDDSGTQDNDITYDVTTTTAPTAAEMELAILKAVSQILGFKDNQGHAVAEVIISRGPWPEQGKQDVIEILFEDGTDNPYAIHLSSESLDRMPLDSDQDRHGQPPRWKLTVWTRTGKALELPCRYRRAKQIPCFMPWANELDKS